MHMLSADARQLQLQMSVFLLGGLGVPETVMVMCLGSFPSINSSEHPPWGLASAQQQIVPL